MLEIVAVKPLIDLLQQLRGRVQIDLGGLDVHMSQVRGQPGEPGVDVVPVAIPGEQPAHGKRVPHVMNAWAGVPVIRDPALAQEPPESLVDAGVAQAAATLV